MGKEIERKFLVVSDDFERQAERVSHIRQAYLHFHDPVVRVRIQDGKGILTIKGKSGKDGLSRFEWETTIPENEAEKLMIRLGKGYIIEKKRFFVPWKNVMIEVDVFINPRKGLRLAEIEFESVEQAKKMNDFPGWFGEEVTGNKIYYNAYMSKNG